MGQIEIIEILEAKQEPLSSEEIAEMAEISQRNISRCLAKMANRGEVQRKIYGKYHIFWVKL